MAFISDEELYETLFSMEGIKEKFESLETELNSYLEGLEVITTGTNPKQTFTDLKKKIQALIPFDDAFIISVNADGFSATGNFAGDFKGIEWNESKLFTRVSQGESVICMDAQKIPEWQQLPEELKTRVVSALCVPLVFADKTAIFTVVSGKKAFFTRSHREIIRRFALLMTQALINAENLFQIREAQRIADLDMRMAINVQKSVMTRHIPESPMWEVAYHFQPMAGVSGDIYDFYNDNKGQLCGVVLYDVSGHGIASGLITMIAKTVSFKSWRDSEDQPLGEVLAAVDREISREIGDGDFYLTGAVLRLKENVVEYANAGHTELLCRKSGKAVVVNIKDDDIKGFFLGFNQGAESGYRSMEIKANSGDDFLIYSDALVETMNNNREQYGLQRLLASMEKMKGESVQEDVEQLVQDLKNFSGKDKFNDDLTVILIRHK